MIDLPEFFQVGIEEPASTASSTCAMFRGRVVLGAIIRIGHCFATADLSIELFDALVCHSYRSFLPQPSALLSNTARNVPAVKIASASETCANFRSCALAALTL